LKERPNSKNIEYILHISIYFKSANISSKKFPSLDVVVVDVVVVGLVDFFVKGRVGRDWVFESFNLFWDMAFSFVDWTGASSLFLGCGLAIKEV